MKAVLRVLVLVPIRFAREGIVAVLSQRAEIDEVVAVADLASALEVAPSCRLAVVDAAASWVVTAIGALTRVAPGLPVVAIGVQAPSSDVVILAGAGATAYVTCDQGVDDLCEVVIGAAAGAAPCSPSVVRSLIEHVSGAATRSRELPHPTSADLTGREVEVLGLLQRGLSNKEIARSLLIGLPTVKNHVHNVLQKLGAVSRLDAARSSAGLAATRP